ncbi:MAG: hypothetical protein Q7T20_19715 [Saprospiraceae bacterium]|nr:hypothetical protein [Saprospiraceae bacterium]
MTTFKLRCILLFQLFTVLLFAQDPILPRRINLPGELKEVSGMTRLPNGDLWLLNDSNNPAHLFRFDPVSGKLLEIRHLPVKNFDWEDLAHDPAGNLYIGDFGNNYNRRQNLRIFRYNPVTKALDSIQFRYPDQTAFPPAREEDWNFNCEAMVFLDDSLHLFSKNSFKGDFYTKHYVLPALPGGEYVAELRDSVRLKNRVVTGAAISGDAKTFVLTGYIIGKKLGFIPFTRASAMYFRDFSGSQFLNGNQRWKRLPKCLISRQFESIAQWEDQVWIVANEGRKPHSQRLWRLKN